jgi:hypothetical protein
LKHWLILLAVVAFGGCGDDGASDLNPGGNGDASESTGGQSSGGSGGESAGAGGDAEPTAGTGGEAGEPGTEPNAVGFVDSSWGADLCPDADGSDGTKVGEVLKSITLKTCEGEDFSLDQLCGADATWIFVAHGWCPHCRAASDLAESLHDDFQANGSNIATVNILFEDTQQRRPEGDDCKAWRDVRGHEDVITLYDPNATMQEFWEEQYTALNVFVSGDRVITGKQHSDIEVSLRAGIQAALADK